MTANVSPARLTALNFGIQFVWGALLAVSLQARCIELAHDDDVRAYATIAALGAVLATIAQIAVGHAADLRAASKGHRREWYWCALAAAPALLWFYLAPSLAQLATAFYVLQLLLNSAAGPYQTAIPDHTPPNRQGECSSWMSGYQSLGNAAGLLVAGFVRGPLLIAFLLAAGLALSLFVTTTHARTLPAQPLAAIPTPRKRIFLVVLASRSSAYLGFYIVLDFLLFFVRDSLGVHDSAAQRMLTALLFLTFTFAAIPGAVLFGKRSDRHDKRVLAGLAIGILIFSLGALAAAPTPAWCYPPMLLAGLAWGGFVTVDWALACAMLPRAAGATAMGIWNAAVAAPQALAPLLAAPVVLFYNARRAGLGPRAAMLSACLALALGALLLRWVPPAFALPSQGKRRPRLLSTDIHAGE